MLQRLPSAVRFRIFMALCLLTLQWVGCDGEGSSDDPSGAPRRSLTRSLTESMRFDAATRVETLLPEATSTMRLESLSEDVLVVPGQQGMLSLQLVDMTEERAVATLMEVTVPGEEVREGQGAHIVVPVAEDQTGSLIHNPFEVDEDLCQDACNAVFEVTVLQAVELEGGEVSEPVETTLIVDCGRDGFPGSCSADDPVVDVCGDAREAQLVYTRERPVDLHFAAARRLARATRKADDTLLALRSRLADELGAEDDDVAALVDAFAMRVADRTAGGLQLLLGEQGCGVPAATVTQALDTCSDQARGSSALLCRGECLARGSAACDGAAEARCRGLLEGGRCAGVCTGACTVDLDQPAACDGTCIGSCSGECPAGEEASCEGPCVGECTGQCTTVSADACEGACEGLCDAPGDGGACATGLIAACVGDGEASCDHACMGEAALGDGDPLCRPPALAMGQGRPLCLPAVVLLSFQFAEGLDASQQTTFADWVSGLNRRLLQLLEILARVERLASAADALERHQRDALEPELQALLGERPDAAGLRCAEEQLPELASRLRDDVDRLERVREDAAALLQAGEVPE